MSTVANAAAALGTPKKDKPSKKTKKTATPATKKTRTARADIPWKKIADLYEAGKSTAEISDTLGLTRKKTKTGKENPYPYYLVVGYLTRLSHGVEVNGQKLKIKRGR